MLLDIFKKVKKNNYYEQLCNNCYYDIHTHILPSVDDGAIDMDMSLKLINAQVEQGVKSVILTPHFRFEENNIDTIRDCFSKLQQAVAEADLPIELYLGGEIYYDSNAVRKVMESHACTMADTRYVLVEFSPVVSFRDLSYGLDEFLMAGFYPILAHAERYRCIVDNLFYVEELVDKGVYIQVNTNSFIEHPKKKALVKLVRDGLVHFIGTDCHRTDWRPVDLQKTARMLAEEIEEEDFCRVFFENPKMLLKNEII